jgi:ribose/xylose/arabinose/galactoside ABC-type transport system permease subunit
MTIATTESANGNEPARGLMSSAWQRIRPEPGSTQAWRSLGLILILAGLIISVDVSNPVFFSRTNVEVLLGNMVMLGIASVGMTFLIIAANVDLSIGSLFALVACITGLLSLHINPDLAFFLSIPIAAGFGLFNGILVWRVRISPLVITLGARHQRELRTEPP